MALGVFSFSNDGRHRLAVVLRALLIAQLVVSLCLVIFCYNTSMRVLNLLRRVHKVTVLILYGMILLQAYCMKLHYTSGLRLISWFLVCPHWRRLTKTTKLWMVSGSMVSLNGMLVYAACRGTLGALIDELPSSLRIGISQYLTEPHWKNLFDTMQVEINCCGADQPDDWHNVPWINMDFLNERSSVVMQMAGTDGKVLLPVSPYSCCTPRVLAACYHDPLQQSEWREVWSVGSPLPSASLHTRGCVEAVRAPLTKALLALQLFNILVVLLQVFILLLAQLLRTSARDAVLRGDCAGDGRGCVLGACKLEPVEEDLHDQEMNVRMAADEAPHVQHVQPGTSACCVRVERRRRWRRRRDRALRARFSYPLLE